MSDARARSDLLSALVCAGRYVPWCLSGGAARALLIFELLTLTGRDRTAGRRWLASFGPAPRTGRTIHGIAPRIDSRIAPSAGIGG